MTADRNSLMLILSSSVSFHSGIPQRLALSMCLSRSFIHMGCCWPILVGALGKIDVKDGGVASAFNKLLRAFSSNLSKQLCIAPSMTSCLQSE